MNNNNSIFEKIKYLLSLGQDSCSEQEVIESIERGVDFRGAKLWILIIAIFVASLGLNTNSTAVIIGAMLISPLMGPIIGMGLGAGIYDFELARRSFRNYIVATLFSILTATLYFFLTPFKETQSELLARTSPTIYDVLIALFGGLAGIIALSSKTQRSGNVIPGVAIATALMPPLCTTGYGIATANWAYAAGAFYLFFINTIFIAFATLAGARFILKFEQKTYIEKSTETRVKRYLYGIIFATMIPAIWLTVGMIRKNTFEQHVSSFIRHEMHFPLTQVISHTSNFEERSFDVVLIGTELDSATIAIARERLPLYKLDNAEMKVIQGAQGQNESIQEMLRADNAELNHAQAVIAQQKVSMQELEQHLAQYTDYDKLSPKLLSELQILCPQVNGVTLARGTSATADTTQTQIVALLTLSAPIDTAEQSRISHWIQLRSGEPSVKVIVE